MTWEGSKQLMITVSGAQSKVGEEWIPSPPKTNWKGVNPRCTGRDREIHTWGRDRKGEGEGRWSGLKNQACNLSPKGVGWASRDSEMNISYCDFPFFIFKSVFGRGVPKTPKLNTMPFHWFYFCMRFSCFPFTRSMWSWPVFLENSGILSRSEGSTRFFEVFKCLQR